MKGERGIETDDAIGYHLRGDSQRVIGIKRGIRKLIEAAAELVHNSPCSMREMVAAAMPSSGNSDSRANSESNYRVFE